MVNRADGDTVAIALADAIATWRAAPDPRPLRRALLRVLAALDDLETE